MEKACLLDYFEDKKAAEFFVCGICFEIPLPEEVTDHKQCGAIYCYSCLDDWVKRKSVCPKCKKKIETVISYSKNSNLTLHSLMKTLQVKCPLDTPGCKWVGNFSKAKKHCQEDLKKMDQSECPYKDFGCKANCCAENVKAHFEAEVKSHTELFMKYVEKVEKRKNQLKNQEKFLKLAKDNVAYFSLPGLLSCTYPLSRGTNPVVYLKIRIEGVAEYRLVFHLFANIVPITVENFRKICIETYKNEKGLLFSYKNSPIHRIVPNFILQGGDIVNKDGTGNCSIYGERFPDENFILKHKSRGILSMSNSGPNTNGCQFFVTFRSCPWLDGLNTVFGELIDGFSFLERLEEYGSNEGTPKVAVTITACGQLH